MPHTLVALVQDHPGVLHRVVSLFRRRGFNIESLAVGHSETPGVSRMTLVVEAENIEQVVKQLYRVVEVLKVSDVSQQAVVERETVLVKIHAPAASRPAVIAVVNAFEAKSADVGTTTMVLEMTGTPARVDGFVDVLRPFGIKEMVRSGRIAMVRGAQAHRAPGASVANGRGSSHATGAGYGRRTEPVGELVGAPESPTSQADGIA
jgi:acetolactate synthase-1/3 small subunit